MDQPKPTVFDHAQNISDFGKKVNSGYYLFLKNSVWPFYKEWIFSSIIFIISSSIYLFIYSKAGFEPTLIIMLTAVIMYSIRDASIYNGKFRRGENDYAVRKVS